MFPPKYGTAFGPLLTMRNGFARELGYTIKECQRQSYQENDDDPGDLGAFGIFSQTATNEDFTNNMVFLFNTWGRSHKIMCFILHD